MKNHNSKDNLPTKEEGLSILGEIHPEVHRSLDHGAFKSRAFFESEGTKIERSLQSMLVRYHAKQELQKKFPQVVFDNLSLCGISLLCKNLPFRDYKVSCRLRLWKTDGDELPNPGESDGKRKYYTQAQFDLPFPGGGARDLGDASELKFAILWNLNSKGILQPLWLVCPRDFNIKTGEIKTWWETPIPDPTLSIAASKQKRPQELPMDRKREVKDGLQ